MTYGVNQWILKTLINHNKQHGANLNKVVRTHRHCQLVKFHTYRTVHDPNAQITGRISDPTLWVDVTFDIDETNSQERSLFGVPSEALTSHLRCIFLIKAFTFELLDPSPGRHPRIRLNLLKWEVVGGDRDDILLFEDAVELGSRDDDEASDIIGRWYFGLPSASDAMKKRPNGTPSSNDAHPSPQPNGAQMPPPRTTSKSTNLNPESSRRVLLETFLEPYLAPGSRKAIPDWLFEITKAQKAELSDIRVFAIDGHEVGIIPEEANAVVEHPDGSDTGEVGGTESHEHTSAVDLDASPEPYASQGSQPAGESPRASSEQPASTSFPQPGQPLRQTPTQDVDMDEDEDEDIPVKKSFQSRRRPDFDRFEFPSSPAEPLEASEAGTPGSSEDRPHAVGSPDVDGNSPPWPSLVHSDEGDESPPPSHHSKAPNHSQPPLPRDSPPQPSAKRARRDSKPGDQPRIRSKEHVLVDASDQSRNKTTEESQSQSLSQSLPNGQRIPKHVPHTIPLVPIPVPADEVATQADDELSESDAQNSPRVRRSESRNGSRKDPVASHSPRKDKGKQRAIPANDGDDLVVRDYAVAASAQRGQDHGSTIPARGKRRSRSTSPDRAVSLSLSNGNVHRDEDRSPDRSHALLNTHQPPALKARAKLGGFKLVLHLDLPYTEAAVNKTIEKAQAKRIQMAEKRKR